MDFIRSFEEHQNKSKQGAAGKFAGGLADNNEQTARLHTATHLLNGALRRVLGEEVAQRGSNITSERLRFDFSFGRKVTKEELAQVEAIVNEAIQKNIDVILEETLNFRRGSRCPKIAFWQSKFPKNGSLSINYCDIFEKNSIIKSLS